jgi:hypothetical protein
MSNNSENQKLSFEIKPDMINTLISISREEFKSLEIDSKTGLSKKYPKYIFGSLYKPNSNKFKLVITDYPGKPIPSNILDKKIKMDLKQVYSLLINDGFIYPDEITKSKKYHGHTFKTESDDGKIWFVTISKEDK